MCINLEPPSNVEISEIAALYGLKVKAIRSCRKVWQLETDHGFKYLKLTRFDPTALTFIYEALEYLHQRGLTPVPRLNLTRLGNPWINYQAQHYFMTDWFFSTELDFRLASDLQLAVAYLAEFHQRSSGFTPSQANYRTEWWGWSEKFRTRLQQLEQFASLAAQEETYFSQTYLEYFETYYQEAVASYQSLLAAPYQEVANVAAENRSFCHHDYSARNLLRTSDHQLVLIDYEYCLRDLRIHDLINLILRNLRHQHWEIGVCRYILEIYHAKNHLTPEEIELMWVIMNWPQDFWQIGLQYYNEKQPWSNARFEERLLTRQLMQAKRQEFLRQFPRENGIYEF